MERTYHKTDKTDVTAFWGKAQDYLSFEQVHISETVLTIQALPACRNTNSTLHQTVLTVHGRLGNYEHLVVTLIAGSRYKE